MTAKQFLDAFSETLMQDERILSPRERELLTSLLQNSRTVCNQDPATQFAVNAAISRAVGETVAQRAFALLGGSIVEQILAGTGVAGTEENAASLAHTSPGRHAPMRDTPGPQPPAGPEGPGVKRPPMKDTPGPQPPAGPEGPGVKRPPMKDTPGPQPPAGPQGLRPVTVEASRSGSSTRAGVLDAPEVERAQCVVLDEFLAPQELEELIAYTLQHEADFRSSEVIAPNAEVGRVDYSHRRSRVLTDLGKHEEVILKRIEGVMPRVLDQLGMAEFPVTRSEAQITASNDGDFFGEHCDNAQELIASRRLTFVYFFHREPRQFEGGELRLHDRREGSASGSYQAITPQQNQIVFFPCSVLHEITPVECPSGAFADSRFTLNGWLHN